MYIVKLRPAYGIQCMTDCVEEVHVCTYMYVHVGFLSISSPGWNWEATALLIAIPTPSIIARMIPPVGFGGEGVVVGEGRSRSGKEAGEKER